MMYQWDLRREDPQVIVKTFWEAHPQDAAIRDFADRLVFQTIENLEVIDPLIERHARQWRLERMETVDRNVLRVAVEELLHAPETPPAVVIDEAIEIVRRYSTSESAQFVNGLLDSVRKEITRTGRPVTE